MAKLGILVGPKATTAYVEALPFLPGLVFHKPLEKTVGAPVFNITHAKSGLAVLAGVDEKLLELTRMILGRVDWEQDPTKIFYTKAYEIVIEEACKVLSSKDHSKKQEERLAEELGGKTQPASGSRWGYRRDVLTPELLVEAKTTGKQRHSVSFKDLHFLRLQAYTQGKVPVYIVQLRNREEIVIFPEQEMGAGWEESFDEVRVLPALRRKKSISINDEIIRWLGNNNALRVPYEPSDYVIISYEQFLDYAKRGIK